MKSLFILLALTIAAPVVISHPAWYLHDHGDSLEHTHDVFTPDHTHH